MFCAFACNPAVATIEYNSGQYIAVPTDVLVGVAGFEPTTSSSRTKRATELRYTPRMRSNARSHFVFLLFDGQLDHPRIHLLDQICIILFDHLTLQTHLGCHHGIFDREGLRYKSEAPNLLVGRCILRIRPQKSGYL